MKGTDNDLGLIPLTLQEILNFTSNNPDIDAQLKVSYIEIYNESVNDLLSKKKNLQIRDFRENGSKSIIIPDLTEKLVSSAKEAY